ncbi:MAG TPA: hypothetical protein DHV12_10370 [Thermotogae bacterium]|nr:hypothetical protein [Thermotogota bacterium]
MNRLTRLYIMLVFLFSISLFAFCWRVFGFDFSWDRFLLMTFLSWILDSVPVVMERYGSHTVLLSGGMLINVITAVLFGPSNAFIVGFVSNLLAISGGFKFFPFPKAIFNASQIGISSAVAGLISLAFGDVSSNIAFALTVLIVAFGYAGVNLLLITGLFYTVAPEKAKERLKSFPSIVFMGLLPMAFVAAVGVVLYRYMGIIAIPIIIAILVMVDLTNLFRVYYRQSRIENLLTMVKVLEERDSYTKGHSERVANYAIMLAKALGLKGKTLERIRLAGLLHDIGKIGIPDKVLNKPSNLTPEEFEEIKTHPIRGVEIISNLSYLQEIVPWIRFHHEAWNGSGYPEGLKMDEIPIEARILAVADVYDALTTKRAYREAFSKEEAINIMKEMKGEKLDPELVDLFLSLVDSNTASSVEGEKQGCL